MDGGGGQEGSAVLDSNKKHEHIADMPSEMKTLLLILGCLNCCHFLSADPCKNHTVLEQPWRSTNCANTDCSSVQCDNNLLTGWYRFNGPGGSTIPDQLVPVNHCSTSSPGWLNGVHPTLGDGEVTRKVCFHWNGDSCAWNVDIKIKRCSDYFVYYLKKPPFCSLAYCTGEAVIPTLPPMPETTVPTTLEATVPTTPDTTEPTMPESTVPTTPETTVPPTPQTTVPTTPETTVPTMPESTVPTMPESTVPTTPESTVPPTPETTVPTTPETTVPAMPESTVPTMPESTVPTTPESTVSPMPETTLPQIASSMIVTNPPSPSPGMGGKQFQLVITLLGDFDPDSMQKIILELQLSFRERFPDLKLHLSLGES
ncbi:uncharacterized protein [Scyliorhinus torazame]|uniref:uncharacterized protein isoform X1 n=2 Tax=Scyliorhinus torazame TaxID=75743 RepID=UPI003B5B98AE